MGTLTIVDNNLSVKTGSPKIRVPINSIELWTDALINFTMVSASDIREKYRAVEIYDNYKECCRKYSNTKMGYLRYTV